MSRIGRVVIPRYGAKILFIARAIRLAVIAIFLPAYLFLRFYNSYPIIGAFLGFFAAAYGMLWSGKFFDGPLLASLQPEILASIVNALLFSYFGVPWIVWRLIFSDAFFGKFFSLFRAPCYPIHRLLGVNPPK